MEINDIIRHFINSNRSNIELAARTNADLFIELENLFQKVYNLGYVDGNANSDSEAWTEGHMQGYLDAVKEYRTKKDSLVEKMELFLWSHIEGSDSHVNHVLKEFEKYITD